jgi:hypothetical protein
MASRTIKSCDNCGRDGTEKVPVVGVDFKRSDGIRTVGDLCTKCLDKMATEYGLTQTARRRRTEFKVTPIDEIPRG